MQENTVIDQAESEVEINKEEVEKTEADQSTDSTPSEEDEGGSKETRWQKGDELTLIRVRFPGNSRSFPFLVGKRNFSYGQKVVASSDRGIDVGYINSFPYTVKFDKSMLPIRSISKVATSEDIQERLSFADKEREGANLCSDLITQLELDMNITHVEVMQFGKKMVFYFTAPSRVDFRELVKKLVGQLKMRIELRQISVRDRAAALGSIGACGLMTCCSSFLNQYGGVSIKMAKNQNLALIPSKLNGVCGQIKCCIKYEDNVYSEKRKRLPKENSFIEAKNGDRGKITRLHVLIEQFEMITDKGIIKRYAINQFDKDRKLPEDWKFPNRFEYVKNENKIVIGIEDESAQKSDAFLDMHHANIEALQSGEAIVSAPETESKEGEEKKSAEDKNQEDKKTEDSKNKGKSNSRNKGRSRNRRNSNRNRTGSNPERKKRPSNRNSGDKKKGPAAKKSDS